MPVASACVSPQSGVAPLDVSLVADSTQGDIVDWEWDLADPECCDSLHGIQITHCYEKAGTYVVRMTVTDREGQVAETSVAIEVLNTAPLASCRFSSDSPLVNVSVTFDASGSTDSDGSIAEVLWEFGDGEAGRGTTVSHVYDTAGVYVVRVTVTDNLGAVGTAEHDMTVCLPTSGGGCTGGGGICL